MDTIQIKDFLQKHHIKPSIQRIAIMEYLLSHCNHPTVDDIYSQLVRNIPTISRTTIYNTLKLFSESNACQTLYIDEKNVRYDANIDFHAHFRCKNCNKIYDMPVKVEKEDLDIDNRRVTITETQIYYIGYCEACQSVSRNS